MEVKNDRCHNQEKEQRGRPTAHVLFHLSIAPDCSRLRQRAVMPDRLTGSWPSRMITPRISRIATAVAGSMTTATIFVPIGMETKPSPSSPPKPWHIAIPGFVYGGVIASLVDCHSTGTAAAAAYRAANRNPGTEPPFRFVTGSLRVDYLKPTPLGPPLTIRARVKEIKGRKVVVESTVYVEGLATARGEVVAVQMPDDFGKD
jgi:acyl-coenzyme A thioesterase PaaI-like protein